MIHGIIITQNDPANPEELSEFLQLIDELTRLVNRHTLHRAEHVEWPEPSQDEVGSTNG